MRINKFIALATGLSRRAADTAIAAGRVTVNGQRAEAGYVVNQADLVRVDGQPIKAPASTRTILLHKPVGYVVSRNGQGAQTIYRLLPPELHQLKPVGRLDKDSSGLLVLTDDGQLTLELTHPRYQKTKEYEVTLNKPLTTRNQSEIAQQGVQLLDGISKLQLAPLDQTGKLWRVTMQEGRNRQIRRTFAALGYTVTTLHRTTFGHYKLDGLPSGTFRSV